MTAAAGKPNRETRAAHHRRRTRRIFTGKPTGGGLDTRPRGYHTHTDYISTTSAHDTTGSGAFRFVFASSPCRGACKTVGESHSNRARDVAPICNDEDNRTERDPFRTRTCSHTRHRLDALGGTVDCGKDTREYIIKCCPPPRIPNPQDRAVARSVKILKYIGRVFVYIKYIETITCYNMRERERLFRRAHRTVFFFI